MARPYYNPTGKMNIVLEAGEIAVVASPAEFGELMQGEAYEGWGKMNTPSPRRTISVAGNRSIRLKSVMFPTLPENERYGDLQLNLTVKANNFTKEPQAKKATSLDSKIARQKARLDKLEAERAETVKMAREIQDERATAKGEQPVNQPVTASAQGKK